MDINHDNNAIWERIDGLTKINEAWAMVLENFKQKLEAQHKAILNIFDVLEKMGAKISSQEEG